MNERNEAPAPDSGEVSETPESADESLSQYFGTAREVLDRYTHCVLCGANLHFTHVTDFSRNLTQEMARCPECGIKVRRVVHKLQ